MIVQPEEFWRSQAELPAETPIPAEGDSMASTIRAATVRPVFASKRSWKISAAATLMILAATLADYGWREMNPTALADATEAYRRDDLETALRLAAGHVARRPGGRLPGGGGGAPGGSR